MSPRPKPIVAASFARPADTTAYASGDLVANNTTAGSVTPLNFTTATRATGYRARILRAGLYMGANLLTNGTFRLHLFSRTPTVNAGDNGAFAVNNLAAVAITSTPYYLGWFEIVLTVAGTGGAMGWSQPSASGAQGQPNFLSEIQAGIYGLLEARAAYVPTSAEVIQAYLEVDQY